MKRTHKVIVVCCAGGLLVLAGVYAAAHILHSRPPAPQAATPGQVAEYLASDAFVRMSAEDRREYLEAIEVSGGPTPVLSLLFHPNVPDEQRQRMLEHILPVAGPMIDGRLDEFDRLPAAEQTARLDAIIDQLQEGRRNNAGTIMASPERLNLVLQHLDPHTRAKVRKHIPALLIRMAERGLAPSLPY
jgi:hypothetical protein